MAQHSAGILVHRSRNHVIEVLLVHPGGPFWARKDEAAWSIPKGEFEEGREDPLEAAVREFKEETGFECPADPTFLGTLKQPGGKYVHAWTVRGNFNPGELRSNMFEMEWPGGSGKIRKYPEIDRAAWFDCTAARNKLHKGQVPFIDLLLKSLGMDPKEF